MKKTEYFYRKAGSFEFEHSDSEKSILLVRLKNDFRNEAAFFSFSEGKWKSFDGNTESLNASFGTDFLPAEFVDTPVEPSNFILKYDPLMKLKGQAGNYDLEDLDESQMKEYLEQRWQMQKFEFDTQNFKDAKGIEKDYFGTRIETDEEKLTLKITVLRFARGRKKVDSEEKLKEYNFSPEIEEESILFDLKTGKVEIKVPWCNNGGKEIELARKDESQRFDLDRATLNEFSARKIARITLDYAFEKFLSLAEKFSGISYDNFKSEKINHLFTMYKITKIPFEPMLYQVLKSRNFVERKKKFKYKRTDPKIFNKFCRKMKIRNTRVLRRCYIENPEILLTSMTLRECSFKDINIYNRIFENPEYSKKFDDFDLKSLSFFSHYAIKKRGQLAALNLILKDTEDRFEKSDAMEMFSLYFKEIPEELRSDIMNDGFTKFNHDALSNISYQAKNKNYTFKYSHEQKRLEDKLAGYEFLLPKNSYHLCEIGTSLHNCVASYSDEVRKNKCTIVYAQKDGEYKICIEVRGNEICQERSSYNATPTEEERKILDEWHSRHGLVG